MNRTESILVVDDHPSVRAGVVKALQGVGFTDITEAGSSSEARARLTTRAPHALIIDINLGDGNGIEVISWVRSIASTLPIVAISFNDNDDVVLAAMKSGASAFVSKSAPLRDLIAAFEHSLVSPNSFSSASLAQAISRNNHTYGLTAREIQIVMQLANGLSNFEFAKLFFISEATLKTHLSAIYRKLGATNRIQAIGIARKAGLISEER